MDYILSGAGRRRVNKLNLFLRQEGSMAEGRKKERKRETAALDANSYLLCPRKKEGKRVRHSYFSWQACYKCEKGKRKRRDRPQTR